MSALSLVLELQICAVFCIHEDLYMLHVCVIISCLLYALGQYNIMWILTDGRFYVDLHI